MSIFNGPVDFCVACRQYVPTPCSDPGKCPAYMGGEQDDTVPDALAEESS